MRATVVGSQRGHLVPRFLHRVNAVLSEPPASGIARAIAEVPQPFEVRGVLGIRNPVTVGIPVALVPAWRPFLRRVIRLRERHWRQRERSDNPRYGDGSSEDENLSLLARTPHVELSRGAFGRKNQSATSAHVLRFTTLFTLTRVMPNSRATADCDAPAATNLRISRTCPGLSFAA